MRNIHRVFFPTKHNYKLNPLLSDFPQKWRDCAIPYGQLKKCLKKVIQELQEIGLDKETLSQLAAGQQPSSDHASTDLGFKYYLDGNVTDSSSIIFRPRLTVFLHLKDGVAVAVDAKLSPSTREFLQRLALDSKSINSAPSGESTLPVPATADSSGNQEGLGHASRFRQVEVPLTFDAQFFEILQTDVSNIGALQKEEQAKLESQIAALGEDLGKAVEPSRGRKAKADLEVWRHVFELYLDARIFFSSRESDHGARTSAQAVEQLRWFQDQVVQLKLVQKLKLGTSRNTFDNFVGINATLLSILKFQEINRTAVSKILKSRL